MNFLKECFRIYFKWFVANAIISIILAGFGIIFWSSIITFILSIAY